MKNWTIGKRINVGFSSVVGVALFVGVIGMLSIKSLRDDAHLITSDCLPGIYTIGQIEARCRANYNELLSHIIAASKDDRLDHESQIAANKDEIDQLLKDYEKTITFAKDRELFEAMKKARDSYVGTFSTLIAFGREGKHDEANRFIDEKLEPAFENLATAIKAVVEFNKSNSDTAAAAITRDVRSALLKLLIGSIAAVGIGAVIAFFIIRGVTRILRQTSTNLNEGADQVASASGQVAAASQSLAEGASEQAASLEETGASLEEMASMTKRNAENAEHAKELSNHTRGAAESGARDMDEMSQAMEAIKTSSDGISKIIKTIDEIAFQTNILALNAAVEAARAGEAGMGFAVVADEVRNLAQRSAQAAKETAEKIEDSIRKSEHGVEISSKVAGSLQQIVEKARQVDELVAEIAAASREQSQGIAQVNTAVAQMDKITQSNAASAEESASASEELNAQAGTLKEAVEALMSLVGGQAGKRVASRQPSIHQLRLQTSSPTRTHSDAPVTLTHNGNGREVKPAKHALPIQNAGQDKKKALPLESEFQDF